MNCLRAQRELQDREITSAAEVKEAEANFQQAQKQLQQQRAELKSAEANLRSTAASWQAARKKRDRQFYLLPYYMRSQIKCRPS
ncbi:MAG: hypothetical protein AB4352_17750 [Hormoscilla sp.]